ncbi:MAG: hypothetical protein ACO3RV_03370 [Luteolibacter sp.]
MTPFQLRFFVSLISLLLIPIAPLLAQSRQGNEISFRVLCYEHRDGITEVFAPGKGDSKIDVPLYSNEFSDSIQARFAAGKASFFIEEKKADGSLEMKLVAEGKLARGNRQAFMFVPADDRNDLVYHVVAFEDDEKSFPMGGTRVINLAPFPIRLNLAGADMPAINPGGNEIYPMIRKVDEWNMYSARIDFEVSSNQWLAVAKQSWKASDRKRDWVIARYDGKRKQPMIRLYRDFPPWREKELEVIGGETDGP